MSDALALYNHLEQSEKLYNILRHNLFPRLERKRQAGASQEELFQTLSNFSIKVARDLADTQGQLEQWDSLFNSNVRGVLAQTLLNQFEKNSLLFNKKRLTKKKQKQKKIRNTEKVVEKASKYSAYKGGRWDEINSIIYMLDNCASRSKTSRIVSELSAKELKTICDRLCLDTRGDENKLKERIINAYW